MGEIIYMGTVQVATDEGEKEDCCLVLLSGVLLVLQISFQLNTYIFKVRSVSSRHSWDLTKAAVLFSEEDLSRRLLHPKDPRNGPFEWFSIRPRIGTAAEIDQ